MKSSKLTPRIVSDFESLAEIKVLLTDNHLPTDDLKLSNSLFVRYEDEQGRVVGAGGLEFYAPSALLRSVAVIESQRGNAIGTEIVSDLLNRAKSNSVEEVYLLTETAHDFFVKRGFVDVGRDQVPNSVRASTEFTSVCPVSAACMVFKLSR